MRTRLRFLLALAVASCIPPAAAQTATITSSVNVRAGPENIFPTVTWLLGGTSVTVAGCTANWRWCDVTAGRDRGWVYARFLSYPLNGSAVTIVRGGPNARPAASGVFTRPLLGRALPGAALVRAEGRLAETLGPTTAAAGVA